MITLTRVVLVAPPFVLSVPEQRIAALAGTVTIEPRFVGQLRVGPRLAGSIATEPRLAGTVRAN